MLDGNDPDIVLDLAYPLPVMVISHMLGVADGDQATFKRWSDAIIENIAPILLTGDDSMLTDVNREFDAYFSAAPREAPARARRQPAERAGARRDGRGAPQRARAPDVLPPAAGRRQRDDHRTDRPRDACVLGASRRPAAGTRRPWAPACRHRGGAAVLRPVPGDLPAHDARGDVERTDHPRQHSSPRLPGLGQPRRDRLSARPTSSFSIVGTTATSPSAWASTTASARRWRVSKRKSPCASCCRASSASMIPPGQQAVLLRPGGPKSLRVRFAMAA